ncbi:MAG TPA: PQQ-dependent sugar dehydrogenase, partial [Candidatus Eisenbacteria bacterium]|nr:PQQ-dependent sugar dehydrogenase [Candidatus Eisenbacteria bacterium]
AGMAFDPGYATNGRFYLSFLDPSGDTKLIRYTVSSNRDVANPSGQTILSLTQPDEDNHKGGMIAFGPDGYLYMSIGDGGGQEDPRDYGQSTGDLFGAVLRLDVSGSGDGYGIPSDNPLFPPAPGLRELWSIGLRNPWRFSFDRSNGDLYLTDVGQYAHEEINVNTNASGRGKGANYGWSITEGNDCFNPSSGCNRTGLTAPILAYDHVGPDCAVIGGYVYRGADIPSLQGTYFYGDHCAGWIKSFKLSGGFATQLTDWPNLDPNGNISSFGQDSRGELYVMTIGGSLYKIVAQ